MSSIPGAGGVLPIFTQGESGIVNIQNLQALANAAAFLTNMDYAPAFHVYRNATQNLPGSGSSFIKNVATATAAPSPSSITANVGSAVSINQGTIIVQVTYGDTSGVSISGVTDSKSNSYVHDYTTTANAGLEVVEFWRCASPTTALTTSDTITATMTGGTSSHGACLIADLYILLGLPNQKASFYTTPGAVTGAVSVVPSSTDVVAIACGSFNGAETTETVASPFTIAATALQSGTTSISLASAYDSNPGSSSITATFTASTAHTSVCGVVTYPAAGANPAITTVIWNKVGYDPSQMSNGTGVTIHLPGVYDFKACVPIISGATEFFYDVFFQVTFGANNPNFAANTVLTFGGHQDESCSSASTDTCYNIASKCPWDLYSGDQVAVVVNNTYNSGALTLNYNVDTNAWQGRQVPSFQGKWIRNVG